MALNKEEHIIKRDSIEMKSDYENWIHLAQDSVQQQTLMDTVMNLPVPFFDHKSDY
jgi:hypothetical protein